jgi:hypothetical protein
MKSTLILMMFTLSGCSHFSRCGSIGHTNICQDELREQFKTCDTIKGYVAAFNCKTAMLVRANAFGSE